MLRAGCVRNRPPRILCCRKRGRRLPPPSASPRPEGSSELVPDPAPPSLCRRRRRRLCAAAAGLCTRLQPVPPPSTCPPDIQRQVIPGVLRRAKFIGNQQHNTGLLVSMVRQQFKKNMHETDPERIQKMKDDAARGLINYIIYESEKMTGRKFSG